LGAARCQKTFPLGLTPMHACVPTSAVSLWQRRRHGRPRPRRCPAGLLSDPPPARRARAPELVSRGRGRGGVRLEKNTGRAGSKRRVRPRPLQRVAPHMRAQTTLALLRASSLLGGLAACHLHCTHGAPARSIGGNIDGAVNLRRAERAFLHAWDGNTNS